MGRWQAAAGRLTEEYWRFLPSTTPLRRAVPLPLCRFAKNGEELSYSNNPANRSRSAFF